MDDAYLANQLRSLGQDNWGVYGARKLWHAARRAGHDLGRDQVARLMRLAGIAGTVRGRHRTVTCSATRPAAAPGPGQAWLACARWGLNETLLQSH
jgi:putative transposase